MHKDERLRLGQFLYISAKLQPFSLDVKDAFIRHFDEFLIFFKEIIVRKVRAL